MVKVRQVLGTDSYSLLTSRLSHLPEHVIGPCVQLFMTLTFRHALPSDRPTLELWDEQPHNIAATGPDDDWQWETELPRRPEWREFLIFELEGRPLGFVQIIDPAEEETRYWGDIAPNLRAIDIWIGMAQDLGKGYGTQMMSHSLDRCFATPEVTAAIIDPLVSNKRAIAFYEKMGFEFVEARVFGEDDCLVYKITRRQWEESQTR